MNSIEGLGVLIVALASLLTAAGTVMTQRSKRVRLNDKLLESDLTRRTTQYQVGMRYIVKLENQLIAAGLEPPKRPKELSPHWGEEDEPNGSVLRMGKAPPP